MTYVASPTFSPDASGRKANLQQCLDVARRHLDETSAASEAEKEAMLVEAAIAAGWPEEEVVGVLAGGAHGPDGTQMSDRQPRPIGLVPSSSV
jgi:hypothetical protein